MEHQIFKEMYFDDFELEDRWQTHAKTVTETDIVMFNNMMGLSPPAIIDEEHMKKEHPFGRRFASGVFTIPFASGLFTQLHLIDHCLLALIEMNSKFLKPIYVGDTIHVDVELILKKETKKPDRGIISFIYRTINQRDETVAEITETILIKKKG